jgi:2-hydroxycyclohexanecarboxyl-CoA dehydrogenase
MKLQGRTAIITGSGRGMGRSAALLFAKEGAKVAVVDIREDEGKSVENEIKNAGGEALFIKTDLTKPDDIQNMVNKVMEKFGKIDILVTNAGWDEIKFFLEQDPKDWDFMIKLNLLHHAYCAKMVIPNMIENKYGKIVMCASDAGRSGNPGESIYSACKGGVMALTKTLARENGRFNITVNCVCPGITDTPLAEEMSAKLPAAEKIRQAVIQQTPLRRTAKPEEIAEAYLFFASDQTTFVTGQVLSVNGGLLMP